MDWLVLVVLFFIGIIAVLKLTNSRTRSSALSPDDSRRAGRHQILPLYRRYMTSPRSTRSLLSNPFYDEGMAETIENYNRIGRGEGLPIVEDGLIISTYNHPSNMRNNGSTTNRLDDNTVFMNWVDVAGDDEELPDDENNDNACKVCFSNKINTVLIPCFHAAVCSSCANRLRETRKCPICRNRINTPRRIFL